MTDAPTGEPDAPEAPPEEPTKTFDADYVAKLRAEAAKYRTEAKANADAATRLAEIEQAQKSDQERAAEAQQQATARAAEAEARALRLEVAFEKGLTPAQAKRLVGGTREELEADADEILVEFPVKTDGRPRGDADQGTRTPAPTPLDPRAADLAQIEADIKSSSRRT